MKRIPILLLSTLLILGCKRESGQKAHYKANIGDGLVCELVALGTAPWKTEQHWWAPNGSRIEKPIYKVNIPPFQYSASFKCAVLFKFGNKPLEDTSIQEIKYSDSTLSYGLIANHIRKEHGSDDGSRMIYIISPYELPPSTDIKIAVCTGAFIRAERDGNFVSSEPQRYVIGDEEAIITYPLCKGHHDAPYDTPCTIVECTQKPQNIEVKVLARLKNGTTDKWSSEATVEGGILYQSPPKRKNIEIDDIVDLIVEYRPYTWITFKNVSLIPDDPKEAEK